MAGRRSSKVCSRKVAKATFVSKQSWASANNLAACSRPTTNVAAAAATATASAGATVLPGKNTSTCVSSSSSSVQPTLLSTWSILKGKFLRRRQKKSWNWSECHSSDAPVLRWYSFSLFFTPTVSFNFDCCQKGKLLNPSPKVDQLRIDLTPDSFIKIVFKFNLQLMNYQTSFYVKTYPDHLSCKL